jgi:hypothetical protein
MSRKGIWQMMENGKESFSEFFAETMAEYWELDSVEQYVKDIHKETCNQYKFYNC